MIDALRRRSLLQPVDGADGASRLSAFATVRGYLDTRHAEAVRAAAWLHARWCEQVGRDHPMDSAGSWRVAARLELDVRRAIAFAAREGAPQLAAQILDAWLDHLGHRMRTDELLALMKVARPPEDAPAGVRVRHALREALELRLRNRPDAALALIDAVPDRVDLDGEPLLQGVIEGERAEMLRLQHRMSEALDAQHRSLELLADLPPTGDNDAARARAWIRWGRVKRQLSHRDEARAAYASASRHARLADRPYLLIRTLVAGTLMQTHLPTARARLDEAMTLCETHDMGPRTTLWVRANQAQLEARMGDPLLARQLYGEVIPAERRAGRTSAVGNASAYLAMSDLCDPALDPAEREQALGRALALFDQISVRVRRMLLFSVGYGHLVAGRRDAAEQAWTEVTGLWSELVGSRWTQAGPCLLALLHAERGAHEDAERAFATADFDPRDGPPLDSVAWTRAALDARAGRPAERPGPDSPVGLYQSERVVYQTAQRAFGPAQ